jgi:Na+-translocating ferredoxin:NAD+ oxidoreductase subunit C
MIKKSFINMTKSAPKYDTIENVSAPIDLSTPDSINILIENINNDTIAIKEGDELVTGKKIIPFNNTQYIISSVTGIVTSIKPFDGNFGKKYYIISIKTSGTEIDDEAFAEESETPSISNLSEFLACIPGGFPFELLAGKKQIKTILIYGIDNDLLTVTNQYILKNRIEEVKKGIEILKDITGIEDINIITPQYLEKTASLLTPIVKIIPIDSEYPSGMPELVLKKAFNKEILSNQFEDEGITFISAEAIASVAKAYKDKKVPVTKLVTFVKKDGTKVLMNARIGTPVKELCRNCNTSINDKDRIIIGGPMKGTAVYIEDYPILNDTDTVIIQDADDINYVSDYPCINCGECVNICPVKVPVNMLVRFLEAGQYETAEDEYDLFSCIECGLCSYSCVSKIPVFQYITLAKYEIAKIRAAEANVENE